MVSKPLVYQLKVALRGFRPPIWRRVLISSRATFYELSSLILDAFGWAGYHLHGFRGTRQAGKQRLYVQAPSLTAEWGVSSDDWKGLPKRLQAVRDLYADEFETPLADYLNLDHPRLRYDYDFGDDWEHDIVLEKILEPNSATAPAVIGGKRVGPPEDSRGHIDFADEIVAASQDRKGKFWRQLVRDWGREELEGIVEECGDFLNGKFDSTDVEITNPAERLAEWKAFTK